MVDYVKTCTNAIYLYGGAATVHWGEFNWGEAAWGTVAENLVVSVYKTIIPIININETYNKDIMRMINNDLSMVVDYSRVMIRDTITNTLSVNADTSSEMLFEENWEYVFTGPTTNAENRTNTTWS